MKFSISFMKTEFFEFSFHKISNVNVYEIKFQSIYRETNS
jgi:hypothetical protein